MNTIQMYCIYHSRDLDGWMSAAIVMAWYERKNGDLEGLVLIGWDYGDPIPELIPDVPVFIVDIAFDMKTMHDIASTNEMTWIDHHRSAILDYKKYLEANGGGLFLDTVVHPEEYMEGEYALIGACELAWGALYPQEKLPEIIRLLGCYDSFRHKDTSESKMVFAFQYAARAYMENPKDCAFYLKEELLGTPHNFWVTAGQAILQYLKVEAHSLYKERLVHMIPMGNSMLVSAASINRQRFNPSSYDINYHDEVDVFICYHRMKDGRWTFSLYNENGMIDVSVIAQTQGGGGHARAAGFVADNLDFLTK